MCGFLGFTSSLYLENPGGILKHRGPDALGKFHDEYLSLYHNRLAILGLNQDSNQPMVSSRGNVLVYNGEIYNHLDLCSKFGLENQTGSDTETLLKLLELKGQEIIPLLRGIFAFAYYEKSKKSILLARDQFGIKPLFYKKSGQNLAFASEVKGLAGKRSKLSDKNMAAFLRHGLIHYNQECFFEDIFQVPAGHFACYNFSDSNLKFTKYWDVNLRPCLSEALSESEILERLLDLLHSSFEQNMLSDVEVALSLSSGMDSRLLAHLCLENQSKFKAYSFGFEERAYDEVRRIDPDLLKHLDLRPYYLKKESMPGLLKQAVYFYESPLGGLGSLCSFGLSELIHKDGIKVILTGEGSDEMFGGYHYYFPAFLKDIQKKPFLFQTELDLYNEAYGYQYLTGTQKLENHLNSNLSLNVKAADGSLSSNDFLGPRVESAPTFHLEELKGLKSELDRVMQMDLKYKKLPKLLHFQDRSSMAFGVENRVPFLNCELAEFLYELPPEMKIKNAQTKYLLKKLLNLNFGYPEQRIGKHYVATPQREWLRDETIATQILEEIRFGQLQAEGWIDFDKFKIQYDSYRNQSELGNSFFVWKVMNLEYLVEQFS